MKTFSVLAHADLTNINYIAWRQFLIEADSWTREQIEHYQLTQLTNVCTQAYEKTEGYRKLFDAHNVHPNCLASLESIAQFPFVTKEEIRDRLEDFSTSDRERCYVTTGGSTGIPFGFYRNDAAFAKELASKAHQYARIGWQEGDRQLVFRGLALNSLDHMQYVPEFEELRCSSYHLQDEQMRRYYEAAVDYRPQWIRCYPSTGTIFADFLLSNDLSLEGVKGVLCASENLYEAQKQKLQAAFGGRVFSHYGHFELAALAGFCEYRDTYHVLPQYGYVELIDEKGKRVTEPGRTGEIVTTSFLMTNTPFIRYRTRDFAVLEGSGCADCGRPYQVWSRIEGRLQEFIVTGDGRYISMTAINMHDTTFEGVRQFQFVQERQGAVCLRYIPKADCDATKLAGMVANLRIKLGADMQIELQPVQNIEVTGRGKHRFLIQHLALQYGE